MGGRRGRVEGKGGRGVVGAVEAEEDVGGEGDAVRAQQRSAVLVWGGGGEGVRNKNIEINLYA